MHRPSPSLAALCLALLSSAAHAQDFFLMSNSGDVYRAAIGSPEVAPVGPTGLGGATRALAFDSRLRLLSVGETILGVVARVDTDSGTATPFVDPEADIGGTVFVEGIGRARENGVFLVAFYRIVPGTRSGIARYDEDTGAYLGHVLLEPNPEGYDPLIVGLGYRDDGALVGFTFCNELITIDLDTGVFEYISDDDCPGPDDPKPNGLSFHRGAAYLGINRPGAFSNDQDRVEILEVDLDTGARASLGVWDVPDAILGLEVVPESLADPATPFGTFDVSDVIRFLDDFAARDPAADLALPAGEHDYSDVIVFMDAFARGSP